MALAEEILHQPCGKSRAEGRYRTNHGEEWPEKAIGQSDGIYSCFRSRYEECQRSSVVGALFLETRNCGYDAA
jgi:hypothetical protein